MGVPAFFRNLVKKYKIVRNNPEKAIKALHIDGNCLFHPQCFKELDLNKDEKDQKIIFEKMTNRIISYIDYLIRLTAPEELVHIAVDGIAPLAKINQQRMRRFGYANNYRHEVYRKHGIKFNDSWNNIVITPGTQFMYDLHIKLESYYKEKLKSNSDPMCKYKIIYSSYMTPGEGEHKILQYIKEHTDPNESMATVIYGLDADLIFLSMASQLPNIYLLRETDQFTRNDDTDPEMKGSIEEELCYVDIDFAKKSINDEFNDYYKKWITQDFQDELFGDEFDKEIFELNNRKNKKNKNENVKLHSDTKSEKTMKNFDFTNDYVFVCYLLGNDFIPHLPSVNISIDGMDRIFNAYMDVFQTFGINIITFNNGLVHINNEFLLELITILASKEEDFFRRIQPQYLLKHARKKCFEIERHKRDIWRIENLKDVQIFDPVRLGEGEPHEWKYRYYNYYFKTDEHIYETIIDVSHNYFEGLLWVAKYYFEKCPTWRWQYKYTHPPFLSDLMEYLKHKDIMKNFNVKYMDPVDIFTQLVSVIPPTYSHILPIPLQHLNSSCDSQIIDMFPLSYSIDMIGKTQLYKCVPIIPHLDISRVEHEVKKIKLKDNDLEKCRIINSLILGKCKNNSKKYNKNI